MQRYKLVQRCEAYLDSSSSRLRAALQVGRKTERDSHIQRETSVRKQRRLVALISKARFRQSYFSDSHLRPSLSQLKQQLEIAKAGVQDHFRFEKCSCSKSCRIFIAGCWLRQGQRFVISFVTLSEISGQSGTERCGGSQSRQRIIGQIRCPLAISS